jgi:hypothetical protein
MPEDLEDDWNLIRPGRKSSEPKPQKGAQSIASVTSTIWVGFFYENREVGGFRVPIQLDDPRIDGRKKPFFEVLMKFTPTESIYIDEFRLFLSDSGGPYFSAYKGAIDAGNNHHASNVGGMNVSFKLREDGVFSNVRISNKVAKSRSGMVENYEDIDESYYS